MTEATMQEILNRLLENLKSGDPARQLDGLRELGAINFSSDAVIRQLEKLALGENAEVRVAALAALKLKTSKIVAGKKSTENRFNRLLIVKEINAWESDGLIESHRAETLRRRYDFDAQPEEPEAQTAPAAPKTVAPAAAPASIPAPSAPAAPPLPRPSLTQVLLSETSVKIYLYLGAFFVIAAAAILAALVEAARLPVLLAATFAFAAGAVGFKRRLPQPSFALSVVFSFLLPIDANVIAESLSLSTRGNEVYWSVILLLMAVIWGLGAWFYSSRLFSLAAFFSLSLGILRFGEIFEASADWNIFSIAIVNLIGLLAVRALKKWRDAKFAQPLFLFIQLQQAVLLMVSLGSMTAHIFDGYAAPADWIAAALAWMASASFYAASDILVPFVFFPWTAAASLFLLPWLLLSAFDASAPIQIAGFAVWGALAAFVSEFAHRTKHPVAAKYHVPLLAMSLPLFFVSILWGFSEETAYGFAAFLGAGIAYTLVNTLRPRGYVWLAALIAGIGAYFSFFALPFMDKVDVDILHRFLGASLLLLLPELFLKGPFSFERAWRWPPIALGALLVACNILQTILIPTFDVWRHGDAAIVLGANALLFGAYALRYRKSWLGYPGTASAALSVVYALSYFDLDGWLPALAALTAIYYFAGYFLARREQTKPWAAMLINSGLALGTILSLVAVFALKSTGGWYALVIAALFAIEMFTRRNGVLEVFVESLLSIALIIILNDFNVQELPYTIFGISLLWLACDTAFHLSFQSRKLEAAAKILGALFAFAAGVFIYAELAPLAAALCFGVYAVFLAAYAWLQKNPLFGYASTSSLALTVFFGLRAADLHQWLLPMIGLAMLYYAAGFFLRRADSVKGWNSMLLFSGLGLGALVALAAPSQAGGLEKAIPIAIAATFYAAEAFARKNVWLGFPANGLYLMAYFVILSELKVDEPQFFSVGAAALGLLMHYLLTRAGNKTAAFITGVVSQLVLLGATYIQLINTGELKYFFVLFFQALVVLGYGIIVRSRSLVIAPIGFAVLAVATILYNVMRDLSLVFIIGITGIILLSLGILAVVMRERITTLAERFGDWEA